MTVSLISAMPQKLYGFLFLLAGTLLFAFCLATTGMGGHLVAVLDITVAEAAEIVNAILTGTISSLPTNLQVLANAVAALVPGLLSSLGLSGLLSF
jgi:hypothetical protein